MNRFLRSMRCASLLLLMASTSVLAAAPACPTIGVAPASLPNGAISAQYSQTLTATSANSTFALRGGQLPNGLTLDASGNLTGLPTATGTFDFSVGASDAASCEGGRIYSVTIACGLFTINALPHALVGNAYAQMLTASGGVAPYVFTLSATSPLLPANLSLASDGTLSGTPQPGTGGSYALLVDIADATSCSGAPVPVTLVVDEAIAITSANATTFTVGTAGSFSVTATGFPTPTLAIGGAALPNGVTFDAGSGTLSGTPAAGSAGTYALTFTASNGSGAPAVQNFTLTVDQPAAITSANTATFTAGNAGTFTVSATGSPTPTLSQSGALPAGIAFNAATGVLSGTATVGTGGSYPLVFTATNGVGAPATQNFTLVIDEAPAFTSANTTAFALGAAGTFTVTASGHPAPTLSLTSGTLPSGVSFNAATGALSGTPAAGSGGSYALIFTAANGVGTDATQSFTLAVTDGAAITSANTTTFTVGSAGTFTVTASGSPTPTLSESGALPSGIAFNAATGVLSGTPAAGTGGSHAIVFTATNGVGAPAAQNFTLVIDEAPAFTSANTTTFALGAAGTFTVTASGHPAPTLSLTSGTLPSGVTFNAATGVLSGTPAAGSGGSYALVFTAANGVGTDATQSFTLAVTDVPAITSANTTTFTVGTSSTFTVTATGSPTPILSESGALPSGITFNAATGVLSGTPASGSGGSYAITFTATNMIGAPATQNFTLVVNEAPAITSANTVTFTAAVPGTFSVVASGYPAPTLSVTGSLPAGVTFSAATGVLSGTTTASGVYALAFTAANGVGADATQAFTLVVNQPPAITSVSTTTFTVGSAGSFAVTATGYPAPTFGASGALPAGVTFAPSGLLAGTPAANSGGSYPITITASNGINPQATQSFTLVVNEAPQLTAPSGSNLTFPIGSATSIAVTGSGYPTPTLNETGALPGGVTFADNGDGSGSLAGTPQPGSAGTYPITLGASNGVGTAASQAFTLTVSCPTITVSGTLPNGTYNVPYPAQTFAQTGGQGTIGWSASGLPAGLAIGATDGKVSGTPTTTTASATVAITASDANQCTGTLTVNNFMVLPSAGNDSYATFGNTQLYVATSGPATPYVSAAAKITANDAGPISLSATQISAPAHGTLSGFAGGGFIYTPAAGYSGADSFQYTVTDGNGVVSLPATVSLNVGQVVWYVNGAGAAGNGSSATPFKTMDAASAAHAAGSVVFVESGASATTTTGAITLKASSVLWGQGVALSLPINNTGATSKPVLTGTVTLGGSNTTVSSVDISTGANVGFTNSAAISGVVVENDVTIATTTASAVSLSNATGNFTFRRISAGTVAAGPVNGIMLNNSSVLSVLGDGSTGSCSSATPTCSGGTIQHTSGDGVSLTAAGAKLALMAIQNNSNSGIKGQGVSTLALTDLLVRNNTNGTGEQAGVLINDLSDPAATATRVEVSGSTEDNVRIHNSAATGAIVFDTCTVTDNNTALGNMGLFLQTSANGKLTGTVQNSILHGNRTIALRGDAGDNSTLSATFKNNTITPGSPNQGNQGIEVSRAITSGLTFNIDGNNVSGVISTLINVFSGGGSAASTATGDVKNNVLVGTGQGGNQYGIRLFNTGTSAAGFATMNANVANNTVSGVDNAYPILAESSGSSGVGGLLKIALTGNTANVAAPGAITSVDAIRVQARNTSSICARISGNTTNAGGAGYYGLQVRQANSAIFNLEGLSSGPQVDPVVVNYVTAQNPMAASVGPTKGTLTGVAANSCGITP